MIFKYFSHSEVCLFTLLIVSFGTHKFLGSSHAAQWVASYVVGAVAQVTSTGTGLILGPRTSTCPRTGTAKNKINFKHYTRILIREIYRTLTHTEVFQKNNNQPSKQTNKEKLGIKMLNLGSQA